MTKLGERVDRFLCDHADKVTVAAIAFTVILGATLVYAHVWWWAVLEFAMAGGNIFMMHLRFQRQAEMERTFAFYNRVEELLHLGIDPVQAHVAAYTEVFGHHDNIPSP